MPVNVLKSVFKWVVEEDKRKALKAQADRDAERESQGLKPDDTDDDEKALVKPYTMITPEEVALRYGVPEEDLIQFLGDEVDKSESCESLPFTLLLVVSYAAMVINHDDAPSINAVEDSIGFDIAENANFAFSSDYMGHKNIHDVNSHADFWSWLSRGLLPLIFHQEYHLSEGRDWPEPYVQQASDYFNRKDRGVLLNYNRIILGVRLSQERETETEVARTGECPYAPMQPVYDRDCIGGTGMYELEPEVLIARKTVDPSREHWFYIHDDLEFVRQQIVAMEHHHWLDNRTQKVELAIPVYNAEYGLHTLIHCNFFFSRGGHIWKAIIPLSAFAKNFKTWHNYLYDFTWLICLLVIIVQEALEILFVVKEYGGGGIMKNYVGFWNFIDWFSIGAGFIILCMEYINNSNTSRMNRELEELGRLDEDLHRSQYRAKGKDYFYAMEKQVHYSYSFRVILAGYPLVIVFRLFKAFGSQPRLAIVTNTLMTARIDLTHFFLVFISVFICYAIAGVVLFGREVASFTTTFRAFITCGRLMFGDFDMAEMNEVGRLDAFFWFLPFNIIIVWILVNMLMAIIMDAYSEVTENMADDETLWTQARKTWKQKMKDRRGETVSLQAVLAKVKKYAKEQAKFRAREDLENEEINSHSDYGDGIAIDNSFKQRLDAFGYPIDTNISSDPGADLEAGEGAHRYGDADLIRNTAEDRQKMHALSEANMSKHDLAQNGTVNSGALKPSVTPAAAALQSTSQMSIQPSAAAKLSSMSRPTPIITVTKLKELFAQGDLSSHQAKTIVRDTILSYYNHHKEKDHMKQVMSSIFKVDFTSKKLRDRTQARLRKTGGLQSNLPEAGKLFRQCFAEIRAARDDLDEWIPEEKEDVPLPINHLLEHLEPDPEEEAGDHPMPNSGLSSGLSLGSREAEVSGLIPGGIAMVLSDETTVIAACRAAGIGPRYDDLRRMSLGREVQIERCDENDSTVLCVVDGVGSVWFPAGAFAAKEPEEPLTEEQLRLLELEKELQVGKETIEMGLRTVNESRARLEEAQAARRQDFERFQQKRREAVELTRENCEQRARFNYNSQRLRQVISERDEYFERVKQLVEENRQLEMRIDLQKQYAARPKMG